MVKGPLFLIAAIAYVIVAVWLPVKRSIAPTVVALAGTMGLAVPYAITRADPAAAFGMETECIGHPGMASKIIQVGVVLSTAVALPQGKK